MYLNGTKYTALFLGCFLSLSAMAKNAIPTVGQGLQKPLCFIENKGQVTDQDHRTRKDIQYKLSTPGMSLYVGNGQLHYQFKKVSGTPETTLDISTYLMDVTLLGANTHAKAVAADKQDYYENYYMAQSDANGITAGAYNKVTYKDVYPNIDWVLYIKDGQVEYDFVVRPGGDAAQIKLRYDGATILKIAGDGGIYAETPMGKVQEKKPYAYESATGKAVAANFKLDKNVVSFETGAHNGSLTIDPTLLWSTYLGSTNEDVATCVKISTAGDAYIGGYTASTAGFASPGGPPVPFANSYSGGTYDAFLSKYNAAGVLQYTTYFGGTGVDRATSIAIDNTANVYLAGYTTSTGLSSGGTVYHPTNNGLTDGFLAKFSAAGGRTWSTYYGGPGDDAINGVACDNTNNVYITGKTASATQISSAGVYQTVMSGPSDAFIAKFNGPSANGANIFSTYFGGSSIDEGFGIACDATNNVIITGQTNSVTGITPPSGTIYQTDLDGTSDAFIAKLNTTGTTLAWSTYYGGPGEETGKGVICNAATSAIAVVGYTSSTSSIASPNAYQTTYGGGVQDAFVTYFTSAGVRSWGTYYGGPDIDYGEGIAMDPSRNVIIAGGTFSNTGIASTIAYQGTLGGSYDAFAAKFTSTLGQRIWGTYYGGALYDYALGVACDLTGQILIAGHTTSTSGVAIGGADITYGGGTYDAFLAKFRPDTFALITQPYIDTFICAGGTTFPLAYTVNLNFRTGNTFTAELSDASGNFGSPTVIGTATTNTSGTITCSIPAGTPAGTGYRIRISAAGPVYISPDNYKNITILAGRLPHVTIQANTPVCEGNDLNLSAYGTWSIGSYNWLEPGGTSIAITQNATVPAITMAQAGVYTVATTHRGCLNDTATVNVVVNNVTPPAPTGTVDLPVCAGGTLSLHATGSSPSSRYSWSGPASFSSTMQNPTIPSVSSANAGNYSLIDTVDGCPSAATIVTVNITPTTPVSITIAVSPNDTICGGTMVNFTATLVNPGTTPTFQWMHAAGPIVGAVSSSWSSSTLVNNEMIWCVMHSNITCPSPVNANSNTIKMNVITEEPVVHIFATPGGSVNPGDSVTFTSGIYNAGVGPLYQWQRNGVDIPGATNDTYILHNVTVFDTITLKVTSTMMCATPNTATSNAIIAHPNTGVANVSSLLGNIDVFPNPNTGRFTVDGALQGVENVSIEVLNPLGQVIYKNAAQLTNGRLHTSVDMSNIPNGVYLMNVTSEGRSKAVRVSVQH